jgi:hypothetical protein
MALSFFISFLISPDTEFLSLINSKSKIIQIYLEIIQPYTDTRTTGFWYFDHFNGRFFLLILTKFCFTCDVVVRQISTFCATDKVRGLATM